MWIKNISKSLYVSFFIKTVFAAIVSSTIFLLLIILSHNVIDYINIERQDELRMESDIIAEGIIREIEEKKLTYRQALDNSFDELPIYQVIFIAKKDITPSVVEGLDTESVFPYDVEFPDTSAIMYISVDGLEVQPVLFYLVSTVISVASFFVIIIFLIFKELTYIKDIESGIKTMATEDILYKIPIKGKNELASLALSINSMGDAIYSGQQKERQNEINQRQLITNMSHDLKTPLTSMTGYIDIIKSKLSKEDELYQYATIAKENGHRLDKLISDLFLYSKLISGDMPINLQSVDLSVVLRQILEIRTENVIFNSPLNAGDCMASIDAEKFHRVMDNLIGNAKKYGLKDTPIQVSLAKDGNNITVSVQNQTAEDLEGKMDKIANRLYTASEDRSNGSSGLGLSISTELVKTMNGNISFDFTGSTFTATIDLPSI